jgi:transposase
MDVHKESISVSVLVNDRREGRPTVKLRNDALELKRLFGRLKKEGEVRACYEAGSCGYEVHRLLAAMKISCDVVAPSLIPVRAGDRVKTDRRDAEKLARLYRAGELTSIRVPTEAEEALRDLVRCREDVREDVIRERDRLLKFLLRHGHSFTEGPKNWSMAHWQWLHKQSFENPTLKMT